MRPLQAGGLWHVANHLIREGRPVIHGALARNALVLAVVSFAVAFGGIWLTRQSHTVATLWLANGILIGTLATTHVRQWPAFVAAAWGAGAAANLLSGTGWGAAIALSSINVTEGLLGAWLISRSGKPDLDRLGDVVRLIAAVGLAAPAAGASFGAAVVSMKWGTPYLTAWPTWFAADALGNLVAAPLAILFANTAPARGWGWRAFVRSWPLLTVAVVTCVAMLVPGVPLLFLIVPTVLLASYLQGPLGAALSVAIVVVMGGAILALAPSTVVGTAASVADYALIFQAFLAILLLSSLPVSALVTRQRELAAERAARARVHRVLDELFTFVGITTLDGTLIEANAAPLKAAGITADAVLGKPFW